MRQIGQNLLVGLGPDLSYHGEYHVSVYRLGLGTAGKEWQGVGFHGTPEELEEICRFILTALNEGG